MKAGTKPLTQLRAEMEAEQVIRAGHNALFQNRMTYGNGHRGWGMGGGEHLVKQVIDLSDHSPIVANIFIFENEDNFIRLNLGFCDICGLTAGHGYFMETIIENNPFGDVYAVDRDPEERDVHLWLVNQAGSISGYQSVDGENWDLIGAFGNYFDFSSVGLGATNSVPAEWEVEDIKALFRFLEISEPREEHPGAGLLPGFAKLTPIHRPRGHCPTWRYSACCPATEVAVPLGTEISSVN